MKLKEKIIILFLLSFIKSFSYINIFPTNFDKRIDNEEGVQSFYISNNTKNQLSYRIYLEKSNSNNDMTNWIEIYPKSINVDTGETKEIKMQVVAPENVKEGEYISNLIIKEIDNTKSREANKNTKVRIFTELKVELAGYVGNLEPKFKIENNKIINVGEIRTNIEVFFSNKKDKKYIGSLRMLKGDTKNIKELNIVDSDYKKYTHIEIQDKSGKILLKQKLGV